MNVARQATAISPRTTSAAVASEDVRATNREERLDLDDGTRWRWYRPGEGAHAMPQDRRDLESRIRRTRPSDCVKGSLFNGICAAVERAVPAGPALTELLQKYRKPFWLEVSDHSVASYLNLIVDAADLLEPRLTGGPTAAIRAIGAAGGRAYLDSLVGRLAVRAVANKTPIEVLSYAPSVYGPSATYGKRWFTRVSEREGLFHCRGDFLPPGYHLGVLPEGVGVNGHRVQIEVKVLDLLDADYRILWDGQPPAVSSPPRRT
jgi:uncharacterized protein (TIGR02265 family)